MSPEDELKRIPYQLLGNVIEALISTSVLRIWMRRVHYRISPLLSYPLFGVVVTAAVVLLPAIFFWNYYYGVRILRLLDGTGWAWAFTLVVTYSGLIALWIFSREDKRAHRLANQEFALLEMKELKTKAELEALQAKINPHFLYNSLNSIASLIHEDPPRAEKMVLLLAKFFRYSTNAQSQYMTRVQDELEMVNTYLEVEKVRFEDRLEYSIFVQNEGVSQCLIPQFLIQPLVENAIKHGIAKSPAKGIVGIKVLDKGEWLQILVIDNGAPFPTEIQQGYGLRSTQDKLRLLCGEDATMDIETQAGGYQHTSEGISLPNGSSTAPYKCITLTLRKQPIA